MEKRRIPRKDSLLATFLMQTTNFLKALFLPNVVVTVGPNSTENLHTGQLPAQLTLRLVNTTAVPGPGLSFCRSMDDSGACPPPASVVVPAGMNDTRTVAEMGGPMLLHLKVTNMDPMATGTAEVEFPLNYRRLGLLDAQMEEWEARAQAWSLKYAATSDPNRRTTTMVHERNALTEEFMDFAIPVVNSIASSLNLTQADREMFNIADPNGGRTPKPSIATSPATDLRGEDGGNVRFVHRRDHQSKRASLDANATGVEVRWAVVDLNGPAPASPADCPNSHVSTRAMFTLGFGVANAGKRLHTYSRWVNLSEPHKNGPWDQRQSIVLSD